MEVVAVSKHLCRPREGTSLVEALTAITLLTVGALGIAATGVASLRLETSAHQRARAASIVGTRIELLHHTGCGASSGTDSAQGVSAIWHATPADDVQDIVDSIVVVDRLAPESGTQVVRAVAPC